MEEISKKDYEIKGTNHTSTVDGDQDDHLKDTPLSFTVTDMDMTKRYPIDVDVRIISNGGTKEKDNYPHGKTPSLLPQEKLNIRNFTKELEQENGEIHQAKQTQTGR